MFFNFKLTANKKLGSLLDLQKKLDLLNQKIEKKHTIKKKAGKDELAVFLDNDFPLKRDNENYISYVKQVADDIKDFLSNYLGEKYVRNVSLELAFDEIVTNAVQYSQVVSYQKQRIEVSVEKIFEGKFLGIMFRNRSFSGGSMFISEKIGSVFCEETLGNEVCNKNAGKGLKIAKELIEDEDAGGLKGLFSWEEKNVSDDLSEYIFYVVLSLGDLDVNKNKESIAKVIRLRA